MTEVSKTSAGPGVRDLPGHDRGRCARASARSFKRFFEALILVIIVVFIFLQGWRATLISGPLPCRFAHRHLCLLPGHRVLDQYHRAQWAWCLPFGLVVGRAIVWWRRWSTTSEKGKTPKEAAAEGHEEVAGRWWPSGLVLSAGLLPTSSSPAFTGKLYQQFAVTIAISIDVSVFRGLIAQPGSLGPDPEAENKGPRFAREVLCLVQ